MSSPKNITAESQSPCIGICMLQKINNITSCSGCKRTPLEIRKWITLSDVEKIKVLSEIKNR